MADLIKSQRVIGQRISRIVTNLKKRGKANLTMGVLQASLDQLKELWAEYKQGDSFIRAASETDSDLQNDPYFKADEYDTVQTTFIEQSGTVRDMISEINASSTVKDSSSSNATVTETNKQRSRAVLPKMALPTFDGQYKDWPSFRDLFTSLIIREQSLSPVERLHYLKTCAKGSAGALLKNIPTTADNFAVAWKKLEDRFENRRLLVQSQIRILLKLAPVKRESASELQRLFDETFDAVDALANLDRPVSNSVDWVVELTVERLDPQSRREWEDSVAMSRELPTLDQLKTFMIGRIQTCEALATTTAEITSTVKKTTVKSCKVHQISTSDSSKTCCLCKGGHYPQHCSLYREKSPAERRETVRKHNLCYNCLGNYAVQDCKSRNRCQKCNGLHHTSIHESITTAKSSCSSDVSVHQVSSEVSRASVILGTARVEVLGLGGKSSPARVLIDPGSEISLISEALAQRLSLQRGQARIPLLGVGRSRTQFTRGRTTLSLVSLMDKENIISIPAYILPELSRYQPRIAPSSDSWPHIRSLTLADPLYYNSDSVDILLGADCYNKIILEGVKRGPPLTPVAQETSLGWILTGSTGCREDSPANRVKYSIQHCRVDRELMESLTKFWEQEEVATTIPSTEDDARAEEHFLQTHSRQADGRFVVRLPFKSAPELGESRPTAIRTLHGLSTKFNRSANLKRMYKEFLEAYESLGHMSVTQPLPYQECYHLPHHGVLRESSTTTKLRVVFNGSMVTSTGKSLNDFLLRGPNLLPNLADVLLRWRRYKFVFSADIEKMYRQILVHPEDRRWQRIVWRSEGKEPVKDYELNTVTYGLACAPYLAIRSLHQLAKTEEERYPRGAHAVKRDIYMDDVLTGADSLHEALLKQTKVRELLMAGGFPLRKWASNTKELLAGLSLDERKGIIEWDSDQLHCVLGIKWLPSSDCFQVSAATSTQTNCHSKRLVLSDTAKLYDPLGWLAPVIIVAKILMQSLWLLKIDWDAPLPEKEEQQWQKFKQELPTLRTISVPRWIGLQGSCQSIELHGFADASERAYAGVVYSRTKDTEGNVTIALLVAKSRVAPLKRVSLPRLELCAAFLVTKLVEHVVKVLEIKDVDVHLWSDSSVTLSWIQGHPSRWPTYVANRVAEIQRVMPLAIWRHVKSADNPADCASRGLYPGDLPGFQLWWQGPKWLSSGNYPTSPTVPVPDEDTNENHIHHVAVPEESPCDALFKRFSKLNRLVRVKAWCLRSKPETGKGEGGVLSVAEVRTAQLTILRVAQAAPFSEELGHIRRHQPVPAKSRLAKLSPFLDPNGVLRVGGRIQSSNLSYDKMHPVILSDDSHLAKLWVDAAHKRCLHGGTQLTLATLRQECWILRGRHLVKSCIRLCTTCIRWKGQTAQPRMGNLPLSRVIPCRPFYRSGVDYAGPIQLRCSRSRGRPVTSKGYIVVFVCLSTKAVHLEAASDASTETFLPALRRFTARRGRCTELYSDCGRNFVGAQQELRQLLLASVNQGGGPFAAATMEGITWHFNPPSAPHFGGIWEAAVKSAKHHLRRVIGDQLLTFEELTTLLTGFEACLNSRALLPLSDDPEDPAALTPGHFLIGEPLTSIPEPSLKDLPYSRLSRWQLIQQMKQHFWKRWSIEYLNSLQVRGKWQRDETIIQNGSLCLIKSELLSPTQWPLARVIQVHPGPDKAVRVATVRTATSQFIRPVHKLILLLPPDDIEKNANAILETEPVSGSSDLPL